MENDAIAQPLQLGDQSQNNWTRLALAECWPGGPIVSNPLDCKDFDRDTWRNRDDGLGGFRLPNLRIG